MASSPTSPLSPPVAFDPPISNCLPTESPCPMGSPGVAHDQILWRRHLSNFMPLTVLRKRAGLNVVGVSQVGATEPCAMQFTPHQLHNLWTGSLTLSSDHQDDRKWNASACPNGKFF